MTATTPPKGRPTAGRRDRRVAQRRRQSRNTTKKFVYVVLAVAMLGAILVLGTGTGGNADVGTPTHGNVVLPLLPVLLSRFGRALSLDPRS